MFKPVAFEPYGRRKPRRVPGWLILLVVGIVVGAAAVIYVQERVLPPRLSASASEKLRGAYQQADAERLSLKNELAATQQKLQAAEAKAKAQVDEVAASRETIEQLRGDVASVVQALPPDPRGGGIEVRAGRFVAKGGMLDYDVVLSREGSSSRPASGVMQLLVAGESAGVDRTITMKPVTLTIGSHEIVRGSMPLPDGFRPQQTTVQILDRVAGRSLGMRVLLVK